MTNSDLDILIVGAGPVGLALAVELTRRGIKPRIIDKNPGPTPAHESRALAYNLRSLDLMAASGMSKRVIEQGFQIKYAQFHWQGKILTNITIGDHKRPDARMTTIPQGTSERIMLDILKTQNIVPEWNTELIEISNIEIMPITKLRSNGGKIETHVCNIVAGCDGAHSQVRKQAGIDFSGESTSATWSLLDAKYKSDKVPHQINAYLAPGSARAHIPVNANTIRIISNSPDLDHDIPYKEELMEVTWRSDFGIAYRMVESFAKGNLYLCGDAAHIHSPVGGRGMNLGIEDACWLAWCIVEDKLANYNPARMKAATLVLAQTKSQTEAITSNHPAKSILMKHIIPILLRFKFLRQQALNTVLGLDTDPPPWL